jgi:hypothetical protein
MIGKYTAVKSKAQRILLILGENRRWSQARSFPYNLHLGFEQALRAAGVEVVTVTTTWLTHLPQFCANQRFDQVWVVDLTHFCEHEVSLEMIVDLAPIRLGLIIESIEYLPEEYAAFPWLHKRRAQMDQQFQFVTHVAAVDEQDVVNIKNHFQLPTIWNPCSAPSQLIADQPPPPRQNIAFFGGSLYGERTRWLEEPRLRGLLARHPSPPVEYFYELGFNSLPGHQYGLRRLVQQSHYPARLVYPIYLALLRRIRRAGFRMWQQRVLQQGIAVVNLPHLVKGYSGRVIEGMAAGRPVISWKIPNRPGNAALFADGKEILLYSTPAQLAGHIEHLLADRSFGQEIAANARRKVKAWHTTEKRVQQLLEWVATGEAPTLGIDI